MKFNVAGLTAFRHEGKRSSQRSGRAIPGVRKKNRPKRGLFIAAARLAGVACFVRATPGDQIFDGHHRHVVLTGERNRFWRMSHGAIVVGQFA